MCCVGLAGPFRLCGGERFRPAPLGRLPTGWATTLAPFAAARKANAGRSFLEGKAVVGMRLYVGNLSYSITSQMLEALFAEYGQVKSAQVVIDRDTGRSKGFGFVEMVDANQAREAIQGLNLRQIEGRALTVNEARPREDRGGGGGRRSGGGRGGYGGRRY